MIRITEITAVISVIEFSVFGLLRFKEGRVGAWFGVLVVV